MSRDIEADLNKLKNGETTTKALVKESARAQTKSVRGKDYFKCTVVRESNLHALLLHALSKKNPHWFEKPSKGRIDALAQKYRLYEKRENNEHLALTPGDISFWMETADKKIETRQGKAGYRIERLGEMELILFAHWYVIEAAEADGIKIPERGDWSHEAFSILGMIWERGSSTINNSK